jgi:predicted metal-binding protein
LVCISCREGGEALADATQSAAIGTPEIAIQRVRCLGNCSRGLSAALRCEDTWTYVFGGLDATRDGPALIAGASLLAADKNGLLPWRDRPEALKKGLIARVPPLQFTENCT